MEIKQKTATTRKLQRNRKKDDRKKDGKDSRKKVLLIVMAVMVLFLVAGSLAWYLRRKGSEGEREIEVMTPYFLYLKNAQDDNSLEFAVGNLHPGETKRVVICVTNKRPDNEQDNNTVEIARESEFFYDLEIAHTENLAVDYNIYELEKQSGDIGNAPGSAILLEEVRNAWWTKKGGVLSDYTDVSAERHNDSEVFGTTDVSDIWNAGKYLLYQKDYKREPLQLAYQYNDNTGEYEYEYDYYLIEIEWQKGITFADYSKETDMVYVVVNAKQVEPTLAE